jgi:predicted amidohydrolase
VGIAQIAPKLGDVDDNLRIHRAAIRVARRREAGLVVFPELSLTGYLLRDQTPDVAMALDSRRFRAVRELSRDVDVVVGFVEEAPGHRFFNAAAYLSRGRVVHVHRKVYLPTYGLFDEARDVAAGDSVRRFDTRFGPAGTLICEDAWHPTNAWLLAHQGAEIVLVLSSGPLRGAKPRRGVTSVRVWSDLLRVTAQFQTSFVIYANRVGFEDGLGFGGGSLVVDPFGRPVLSLPALDEAVDVVELDAEVLRRARVVYPVLRDENLDMVTRELGRIRRLRFDLPPDGAA